jgi:hypothetical protein
MKDAGKDFEMKIYPSFGRTQADGHAFGYFGSSVWADDISAAWTSSLEKHKSLLPSSRPIVVSGLRSRWGLLCRKFVVSTAGEAYDARKRGPNRKFRLKEEGMSLAGKHALVTGSSRGIGRGIALKLTASFLGYSIYSGRNGRSQESHLCIQE